MIFPILKKELRDHLRDHRSLTGALALPLMGPMVFLMIFHFLSQLQVDKPVTLPVVGGERAPALVSWLAAQGLRVEEGPSDPEGAVRAGDAPMVLEIGEAYAAALAAGRPAPLRLYHDASRTKARRPVTKVLRLLQRWSGQLGALRLMARGVSPSLASPIQLQEVDLSTPERMAANVLNMIPLFLMMAALVGGMNVSIDLTAGERERGSLEPLLLNPVPRGTLVIGKWLAATAVAAGVVLFSMLTFSAVIALTPLDTLGLRVDLGPQALGILALGLLPLAALGSAIQMLVATFARSFKEAQTYLNLLNLVPVVPAMIHMFGGAEIEGWMMWVPTLAQETLVVEVLRGGALPSFWWAAIAASSALITAACLWALTRLLHHERIIYGR